VTDEILFLIYSETSQTPWAELEKMFRRFSLTALADTGPSGFGQYEARLPSESPETPLFREELERRGLAWRERREVHYEPEELDPFPLNLLIVRKVVGDGEKASYDLTRACPDCGTGAVQMSPLQLNRRLPKRSEVFATHASQILVSDRLAATLAEFGESGLELRQATASDGESVPWFQLIASETMPPLSARSRGIARENQCKTCGRDGFFSDSRNPYEFVYNHDSVDVDSLPDAVVTWEHFGNSNRRFPLEGYAPAQPMLLLRPTLSRVLVKASPRHVEALPVRID
jgi:hypothetical protein